MAVRRMRYADVSACTFSSMCLLCGIRYEGTNLRVLMLGSHRETSDRKETISVFEIKCLSFILHGLAILSGSNAISSTISFRNLFLCICVRYRLLL